MEPSGVNRLLAFAQELGVRETNRIARPDRVRRASIDRPVSRSEDRAADPDLKVSLSATASRLAEGLTPAPPASDSVSRTSDRLNEGVDPNPLNSRRGRGTAAYTRNSSAVSSERISLIA